MEKPLYKCVTKATNRESGEPRYSQNWAMSKRGKFKIFTDKITCGSWTFNISKITNVILYKTKQMFIPVKVLKFEYEGKTYQFGFNPWANPMKYLNIDYKEENVKLRYSIFSIVYRLIIIGAIIMYMKSTMLGK